MSIVDHATMIQAHVAEFGNAMTLSKKSAGIYSDVTRTYSGETTTTYDVVAFVAPYKVDALDGTMILRGDLEARFSASALSAIPVTIERGDFLALGGMPYEVVNVDSRSAGDIGLMVIVQMRGVQ